MADANASPSAGLNAAVAAQPAAKPQAKSPREVDNFAKARNELLAKRKLRLASTNGEQVPSEAGAGEATSPQDEPASISEGDETTETQDPEKEATWAQKLREDLGKKTDEVKALRTEKEARDREWSKAVTKTQHRIEDLESDLKWHTEHVNELYAFVQQVTGRPIDPVVLARIAAERKAEKLERVIKRGTVSDGDGLKQKMVADGAPRLQAVKSKYAELDVSKNKDAKEFFEDAIAKWARIGSWDFLESAAERWVRGWRAQHAPKPKATVQAKPAERPTSSTLAGAGNSGRSPRPTNKDGVPKYMTDEMIKADARRNRARKG